MSQTPKKMSVNDYANRASQEMTKELYRFVKHFEKQVGPNTAPLLVEYFICNFVETIVQQALTVIPKSQRKEPGALEKTRKEFGLTKNMIQDSVADGFALALMKFSGKHIDYYCEIAPIGEPINDMAC